MNFRKWFELMEPNVFTAKDPANGPHMTYDDQNNADNQHLPLGMRLHKATNAFPQLTAKMKKRCPK